MGWSSLSLVRHRSNPLNSNALPNHRCGQSGWTAQNFIQTWPKIFALLLNSIVEVDNRPCTVGSIEVTMGGADAAIDYCPRKLFFDGLLSGTNSFDGGGINRARRVNSSQTGQDFPRFASGGLISSEPQTELNELYILGPILRWAVPGETTQSYQGREVPGR